MIAIRRWLGCLWASPCSALGLAFGLLVTLCGGRGGLNQGCIEFTWRRSAAACPAPVRRLRFRAITLGHVIVALSDEDLAEFRAHEQVHVRQYARWGVFFVPAYALSSAWQLLRGRAPYWDNAFELQARRESAGGRPNA